MNQNVFDLLDEMVDEGYFGENARALKSNRDNMEYKEHAKEFLNPLIEYDDIQDIGRRLTCRVIITLHYFHVKAIMNDSDKLFDCLKIYLLDKGGLAANSEIIIDKGLLDKKIQNNIGKILNNIEKRELSNNYIQFYEKCTETCNKNLGNLIDVINIYDKVELKQSSDRATLNSKIIALKKYNNGLSGLTDLIDRQLRNCIAHNNIRYNTTTMLFESITDSRLKVKLEDMLMNKIPSILMLNRGFISSIFLIMLAYYSKDEYIEYYEKIKSIANCN